MGTIEDIEFRDKREKMELKEKEKKDKMREERLRRMQAFQASSVLREEREEDNDEIEDEDEEEKEHELDHSDTISKDKSCDKQIVNQGSPLQTGEDIDLKLSEDIKNDASSLNKLEDQDRHASGTTGTTLKDDFKRVTRAEWNKMTYKEKKNYLKERRKRKQQQTIFIKDDSDNEQLSSDEGDDGVELEFSDSEDEKDKGERLAKEALKSYAKAFTKEEHPEDYKLVMRKDTVEAELADEGLNNYETIEDIEFRDKREKMELKE